MGRSVIAAQLYTVRDFMKTSAGIAESLKKVGRLGYKAVELAEYGEVSNKELKTMVEDAGLTICAAHCDYGLMRDEPNEVVDLYKLWECKHSVIGGIPGEYRTAEGYVKFAKEASGVARRLAEDGLTFSYHNHSFELEKYGDRPGLQILHEESDPKYFSSEIDTYWIQHGGGDPAEWIRRLDGRACLVHFKDLAMKGSEQRYAEVGEGNLNWPRILDACREVGTEWYIVEQDLTYERDPFESLGISLRNLKNMGLE